MPVAKGNRAKYGKGCLMTDGLNIKREILRKAVHISTSVIPLVYYFSATREQILYVCVFIAAGFLIADILRINFALVEKYFLIIFSKLLRINELKRGLTGATYLFIGITAAVYLFPKEAAIPAVLFLTAADPAAAIAGKLFGSKKYFGKTIEGTIGFFLIASVVILLLTDYSWMGLGVAFIAAIAEFFPTGINDNLVIPVLSGFLLTILI